MDWIENRKEIKICMERIEAEQNAIQIGYEHDATYLGMKGGQALVGVRRSGLSCVARLKMTAKRRGRDESLRLVYRTALFIVR